MCYNRWSKCLTNTSQLWEEDGNYFRQLAFIMKNQKCKLLFPNSPIAVVKLNAFVSWVSITIPWCVARVLWKGKSLNAESHLKPVSGAESVLTRLKLHE